MRDDPPRGHKPEATVDERLEELNTGQPTKARPAAAVILLRHRGSHGSRTLEVLLGRRTERARFMANVWVFPGGAVDRASSDARPSEAELRATALRELEEEVAVKLSGTDQLVPFARWITPTEVKTRFDTHFYLALAPSHATPEPDGEEIVAASWFAPQEALDRHAAGELLLVFPTVKQLQSLSRFDTAERALADAASQTVEPILPRVVVDSDGSRVLLPGDPGYGPPPVP